MTSYKRWGVSILYIQSCQRPGQTSAVRKISQALGMECQSQASQCQFDVMSLYTNHEKQCKHLAGSDKFMPLPITLLHGCFPRCLYIAVNR